MPPSSIDCLVDTAEAVHCHETVTEVNQERHGSVVNTVVGSLACQTTLTHEHPTVFVLAAVQHSHIVGTDTLSTFQGDILLTHRQEVHQVLEHAHRSLCHIV